MIPIVCLMMIAGCDSSVESEGAASAQIEGQATDNSGYGKTTGTIEGATVTAANVHSDGNVQTLSASTTTNASGEYSLEISDPSPVVMVKAEKDNYSSSTLVYIEGDGSADVQAQPINVETEAEANVYVDAKSNGSDHFTVADAAIYVDKQLAAQIESGATSSSEVAGVVATSADTEAEFIANSDAAGEAAVEQTTEAKTEAYADLQASLANAGDSSAETDAMVSFQQTIHDAYLSADIPAEVYAKARQSAHATVTMETEDVSNSSDTHFSLRQQSEIATSAAVAQSIEASFEANNASQSRLSTLADARSTLVADLRSASSVDTMVQAKAAYQDTVESELAAELDVSTTVINTALEATSDARATLDSALSLGISASASAEAYSTFYGSAESAAASSLGSSGKAEMGGQVIAMLSVH